MATAILALNNMFGKVSMFCVVITVTIIPMLQDIQCMHQDNTAKQAITQYCWVSGTYTVPGRYDVGAGLGVEAGNCWLNGTKGLAWYKMGF